MINSFDFSYLLWNFFIIGFHEIWKGVVWYSCRKRTILEMLFSSRTCRLHNPLYFEQHIIMHSTFFTIDISKSQRLWRRKRTSILKSYHKPCYTYMTSGYDKHNNIIWAMISWEVKCCRFLPHRRKYLLISLFMLLMVLFCML